MVTSNLAIRTMKRTALVVIGCVALTLSAQAQTPEQRSEVQKSQVIVTGEGNVTVTPSYAQIRSGVTTDGKTVKQASDANTKLMSAVIQALLDFGTARKDIQTSQFSIEPVYASAVSASSGPKLSGFRVSNQVRVTVRDISQLAEILDRLVNAGATDIGHIAFLVSEPEKPLDQAREAAIADARRKAELYARAAGVQLGRVAWITEGAGYVPAQPIALGRLEPRGQKPIPIESGEETLRASVTVGFDLAQ